MTNSDVISAFIDHEPFDAQELADALADPAGRALLLDLVALRSLAQPEEAAPATVVPAIPPRRPLHLAVAAVAVLVALVGGYQWGERSVATETSTPPAPARVVSGGAAWVETNAGGGR